MHGAFQLICITIRSTKTLVLLVLLMICTAFATVTHVPADIADVTDAVNGSSPGDTILIADGLYHCHLHLPHHDLTLASHYLFDGDTAHVAATMLDGSGDSTVIDTGVGDKRLACIGLTIQNGRGHSEMDELYCYAGGLAVWDSVDVSLDHVVFRDHTADFFGLAMRVMPQPHGPRYSGSVTLNLVRVFGCQATDGEHQHACIYVCSDEMIQINDFVATPNLGGARVLDISTQCPLVVDSLVITGFNEAPEVPVLIHFSDDCTITNTRIYDNSNCESELFGVSTNAFDDVETMLRMDRLIVERNSIDNVTDTEGSSRSVVGISADSCDVRNVRLIDNSNERGQILGISCSSGGRVDSLLAEGNYMGGEWIGSAGTDPSIVGSKISITNSRFQDNTIELLTNPDDPYDGVKFGNGGILAIYHSIPEYPVTLENIEFLNNTVIDHDSLFNTSLSNGCMYADYGYVLHANMANATLYARNLHFEGNRHYNVVPDNTWMGGSFGVSGVFAIEPSGSPVQPIVYLDGVRIEDCDDGGIFAADFWSLHAENIEVINSGRMGVFLAGYNAFISNVYIDGIYTQEFYHSYPYRMGMHSAATCSGWYSGVMENFTVVNCTLPVLFYFEDDPESRYDVRNSIIVNNQYDLFQDLTYPAQYQHCYLQESMEGFGNIIGDEPGFDPDLGVPFLASTSPCIDAGLDSTFDQVDQDGFAIWPSQGDARADIGYTGGLHAAVLDTSWYTTGLPHIIAPNRRCPASPTLGSAYPNPFNPVTTIPFTLPQAGHFTLQAYNLRGQFVQTLADTDFAAGEHLVTLDGNSLASGVYLICLRGEGVSMTRKALLLK